VHDLFLRQSGAEGVLGCQNEGVRASVESWVWVWVDTKGVAKTQDDTEGMPVSKDLQASLRQRRPHVPELVLSQVQKGRLQGRTLQNCRTKAYRSQAQNDAQEPETDTSQGTDTSQATDQNYQTKAGSMQIAGESYVGGLYRFKKKSWTVRPPTRSGLPSAKAAELR
jgi:hypothetical protein